MSDLNLVKELREKTGAGFLDCKNALKESKITCLKNCIFFIKSIFEDNFDFLKDKKLLFIMIVWI